MADAYDPAFRHLNYSGRARARKYTAKGTGGSVFRTFPRRRAAHARKLQGELRVATHEAQRLTALRELSEYADDVGVTLEIRSEPDFSLNLKALDAPRFGVTLDNVRQVTTSGEGCCSADGDDRNRFRTQQ